MHTRSSRDTIALTLLGLDGCHLVAPAQRADDCKGDLLDASGRRRIVIISLNGCGNPWGPLMMPQGEVVGVKKVVVEL